ncbi:MAG TPA: DNA translocase FtsK 4TM domain-containing protein [Pyrinomonadaceae bacterium]|nr:DNA translocase FtsK 4TM domain-containing protein [Acidobacteriota bacterium]HQZ95609.1 DNA translocase FtsK 4TM domain-containing protein [Pyrinomonadaceae bacterium]
MKICPTCNEVYKDDDINFCLADGTTLLKKRGAKAAKHSHWNDVVAIILAAVAVMVLLCLITSSADDRSWISTGSGAPKLKNWVGVVGANIAAVLFSTFGWTAYLIPVLIAVIAWRVFQSDTLIPRAARVAGYVFFAVSLSGLITLFGGYGAIVGEAAAQGTMYFIGSVGTGILLTAIFVSSILLITNFTLAGFLSHFDVAGENLKIRIDEWRDKRREARHDQIEEAKLRADKRKGRREPFPKKADDEELPATIPVGNMESLAAAAAVGRAEPMFDDAPSIPTIETREDPYETQKVVEPEFEEIPFDMPKKRIRAKAAEIEQSPAIENDEALDEAVKTADAQAYAGYLLPDTNLLTEAKTTFTHNEAELRGIGSLLEQKTAEFSVPGKVVNIMPGPVVTTFEFKPAAGVKYSRVTSLVDDLCLALKAPSIRIDRIPGKAYVGIEVPNQKRETIYLREVIESAKFKDSGSLVTLGLGKTIDGAKYVADLTKMPHLLIAGATGAGKSVGINTLVMSILYKARPDEVKFIMVDPKQVELGLYADIPHLATPIITDPKRAATALRWAVVEMEKRYKDLAKQSVRNIAGFNEKIGGFITEERLDDNGDAYRKLPYIVIIIDELADLMMVSGKEVEESITRLAQMARAVGIHLILATQRPSVDVITGIIKANMPTRIAFRVSSKVDSRTIIDGNGAESLLGQGDMLFLPPGQSNVIRVHGAFVDEGEINDVVEFVKAQGRPEYDTTITKTEEELDDSGDLPGRRDPLFMDALKCVVQAKRGSTSLLQRHLRIGYGRAAAILDAMVREGYIGEMDGSSRARPVLPKAYEDLQDVNEGALGDEY